MFPAEKRPDLASVFTEKDGEKDEGGAPHIGFLPASRRRGAGPGGDCHWTEDAAKNKIVTGVGIWRGIYTQDTPAWAAALLLLDGGTQSRRRTRRTSAGRVGSANWTATRSPRRASKRRRRWRPYWLSTQHRQQEKNCFVIMSCRGHSHHQPGYPSRLQNRFKVEDLANDRLEDIINTKDRTGRRLIGKQNSTLL